MKKHTPSARKSRTNKKGQKKETLDILETELDTRSWWLGIKQLKNDYKPIPYSIKGEDGKEVNVKFLPWVIFGVSIVLIIIGLVLFTIYNIFKLFT